MDALFIIFVLWVLFMLFFESIVQPLFEVLAMLAWFIALVLITAITSTVRFGGRMLLLGASWTAKTLWRCPSPLKLGHYDGRERGTWNGSETIFGRRHLEAAA